MSVPAAFQALHPSASVCHTMAILRFGYAGRQLGTPRYNDGLMSNRLRRKQAMMLARDDIGYTTCGSADY
jgi:hypothetical protein